MNCPECDRLWKLYNHRRTIHVKLTGGARWGDRYLKDAIERAENERADARRQLLDHGKAHRQKNAGSWFTGELPLVP